MKKISLGSRRQALLLGSLGLVLVLAVVRWRPGGAAAPVPTASSGAAGAPGPGGGARRTGPASPGEDDSAPAPAPRGRRASSREVNPDEVPELDTKDFDPPKSGTDTEGGRDLFGPPRLPTAVPPPTATPRPPLPCEAAYVGPCGPPSPTPTPKPPDITFKFLGSFGPREHPIAVIQQGDEVFNARAGDTLFGKFVLRNVGYESIDVGFVGFAPTETRRLPVAP